MRSWGGVRFGTRIVDSRTAEVEVPPDVAFAPIQRIGGTNGWYYGNILWKLRGWLDLLVGGVGLRRGRRDPLDLQVGDAVDFWRVEAIEPGRRLRLAAEMRAARPGLAGVRGHARPPTARWSGKRRSSTPWGWAGWPTGTPSIRCTASCFRVC